MASPITFSGFNQIDFNVILNAVMDQESRPLQALQAQQKALQATDSSYGQLASKLDALETATSALATPSTLVKYSATSSDTAAVTASATTGATPGAYHIVVTQLASAQVTVTHSTATDVDTTVVATGGSLTIGTATVTLSGPVTLGALADAINAETTSPASATIVQTAPNAYRLVLTGKETGAQGFTIQNALTGSSVEFTNTNGGPVSGDSEEDNAVQASDAALLVNNIAVTSHSNTLDSVIPGVTLTLLKKDAGKTIDVTVGRDDNDLADRVDAFAAAYNDLVTFADDQASANKSGKAGNLGNDTVLKSVRNALRSALSVAHGSGTFTRLGEVGIEFERTGQLSVDREALTAAIATDAAGVHGLFADSTVGAFKDIETLVKDYTSTGGFVPDARTRVSDELSRLARRMDDVQDRLDTRRASLQKEYIAADLAMTRLNAQKSALASFGSNLSNS